MDLTEIREHGQESRDGWFFINSGLLIESLGGKFIGLRSCCVRIFGGLSRPVLSLYSCLDFPFLFPLSSFFIF